jgi:SmpA / OmlA family
MKRPFRTRFANFLIGFVPLILCLLICLVCATPLPVETLEEGMTPSAVRQAVGEPRFIAPNGVWIYTHEEQNLGGVVRKDVFLHFDDERLVQWQVTEPFPPPPPFVYVSPSFVDASLPKCEPSDESGHLSR